jgi:uncharacterized protein
MLLPFKLCVGGRLGSGEQWMSWIALADVVGVLRLALSNGAARGPINTVSPQPVSNIDFTKALAKALHRPAIFPVPEFALHILIGEMADDCLLCSQRVLPEKLQALRFKHQDPELGAAFARIVAEKT